MQTVGTCLFFKGVILRIFANVLVPDKKGSLSTDTFPQIPKILSTDAIFFHSCKRIERTLFFFALANAYCILPKVLGQKMLSQMICESPETKQ